MTNKKFTTNVYYEKDADRAHIDDKTVAVIGYGSQGHAHARNLHDSGVKVIVGLRENSSSWETVKNDGLNVATPIEATKEADIIMMLVPDTAASSVYKEIEPAIEEGNTLMFAHGFNIHYSQVEPPSNIDVSMIAPKSPGNLVRRNYVKDQGTPALLAIYQDYTGKAKEVALAYAEGIGCARAGVVETSFQEEVESDLFGEQVILCGGVTSLMRMSFETLVENGYSPEMAYFECLNELKLIVDLIYEGGLMKMWTDVSDTAEYGGLTRGPRVVDERVKENMAVVLKEIQDGTFAKEWIAEDKAGRPKYNQIRLEEQNHQIEKVGVNLRSLFSWSEENE
ncbi:MAG: ketol-acid reductoisomerase [Halobacteriales archaeon]|tara:strand:- start:191 stop:1204 length:1014 start_codon:yes stop_codon:yes gene_type:complete